MSLMRIAGLALAALWLISPLSWTQTAASTGSKDGEAEEAKREQDFKMPEIIRALGLANGSKVADIGAGGGDYETALSRAVGADGRVYAEDISEDPLKRLRERVKERGLGNVEVIQGTEDDPKLPGGLDAALMVIMYHEISDPQKVLKHVVEQLKPGGRLVVVDMAPHKTRTRPRADQVKNHVIASSTVQSELREAGLEFVSLDEAFIDNPDDEATRWMLIFRKPGASSATPASSGTSWLLPPQAGGLRGPARSGFLR